MSSVNPAAAVKPAIKPKPKPRSTTATGGGQVQTKRVNEQQEDERREKRGEEESSHITTHSIVHENKVTTTPVPTLNHSVTKEIQNKKRQQQQQKQEDGIVNVDANGYIMRTDVREDEDQGMKLREMIELLVAAGYFRARIKGLSDFDKIIGGICWAIEMCDVDVDIDLLFHESLTIGQKM